MQCTVDRSIEVLTNTPAVLRGLLGGLSNDWIISNTGPETFSPFDVVGHLLHGERDDWMKRLRIILKRGDAQPFEPFDRYAMYESSNGKSINDLLGAFATERAGNLDDLRALKLTEAQLELPGMHPELGRVNARQLLGAWVVHDLHHIAQICSTMAHEYRNYVGVWGKYLGILQPR